MDAMNEVRPAWRRRLQFCLPPLLLLVLVGIVSFACYVQSRKPPLLGLDGYCPVTLVHKREWQIGDPQYDAVHEGCLYLFVGEKERDLFRSYPDRYAPIRRGADIVQLVDKHAEVQGERAHGVTYNGCIYLFESESTLKKFETAPDRYAMLSERTSARWR